MLPTIVGIVSAAFFLSVIGALVFLLLVPRKRLAAYLKNPRVRLFVEYFGNVTLDAGHPANDRDSRSSM